MFFNELSKYGKLLSPDIKLHRKYFDELVRLIGVQTFYRAPKPGKIYTVYTEILANYYEPILLGCIFHEHPSQLTLKKMGWVSELGESSCLIDIPYDTPNILQGALFYLPSGLDSATSRLFRVVKLLNSMIYPAAITCEVVPEYENTYVLELNDYKLSDFNLLSEEEDCNLP